MTSTHTIGNFIYDQSLRYVGRRMRFVCDDGGRAAAGLKGNAGDCVARAVAIASGRPYAEVYARLAQGNATQRKTKRVRRGKGEGMHSADHGICTRRKWFDDYMTSLGAVWVPTMKIGSGCKVHLRENELPKGRLVVNVTRHMCAVIDGVIHDTHNPDRNGT